MIKLPVHILLSEPIRHYTSQSPSTPTFYNAFDTPQNGLINPTNNYGDNPFNYDPMYEKQVDGTINEAQYQSELSTQYADYNKKDKSNSPLNDASNGYPILSKSLSTPNFSYKDMFKPRDETSFESFGFGPYSPNQNMNSYNDVVTTPIHENNIDVDQNNFNSHYFEKPSLVQQEVSSPFDSFSLNGNHDLTYGQVRIP